MREGLGLDFVEDPAEAEFILLTGPLGMHDRVEDYQDREEEGILYVAQAGEMLYRYQDAGPELGGAGSPQS